jgi:SAM-dependent methyltransferase
VVNDASEHWESVWSTRERDAVSWYQDEPTVSLDLIDACGVSLDDAIVDVGGGACVLAARLLARGHRDVTVVDIASAALRALDVMLTSRIGPDHGAHQVCADVLRWDPDRRYRLWHDRAVNHFLIADADRRRYAELVARTVPTGGHLVLAAFAPDGPEQCSGLAVHRSDPRALADEFGEFELLRVVREQHLTPWGSAQSFHYLLLIRR